MTAPTLEAMGGLTIHELSERSGLSARNIRAYRTMGLLPAPELRDGVGVYGAVHEERLERIARLREKGFNLKSIRQLIEEPETVPDLKQVLARTSDVDPPRVVDLAELQTLLGEALTPELVRNAIELGGARVLENGRIELPTPALLEAAAELRDRGIPLEPAIPILELTQRQCEVVAGAFLDLFEEQVWRHFQTSGYPKARWAEVAETVERLRPMASRALLAIFRSTMDREIQDRFGDELERMSQTDEESEASR